MPGLQSRTCRNIVIPAQMNYLAVFLTFACPRKCPYCINEVDRGVRHRGIVSCDRWIDALNRLETSLPITFHGGEPLAHPDFFEILNGLDRRLKADLLTTLPDDVDEFIQSLSPDRFSRDLPYSAIRVTYHPEQMNLDETLEKAGNLRDAGFDVSLNVVRHTMSASEVDRVGLLAGRRGVPFVVKPFLGYLDAELHGQYKYVDACRMKQRGHVTCCTTNMLIDPQGTRYRCHRDLFCGDPLGVLGNIFDEDFEVAYGHTQCKNFGFCNPCDVQIKFDKDGRWGYTAVDIRGEGVAVSADAAVDWQGDVSTRVLERTRGESDADFPLSF